MKEIAFALALLAFQPFGSWLKGPHQEAVQALFRMDNLIAWCIVPFDGKRRTPTERVDMLKRLGFRRYAYDWRSEHLPTFEAEVKLLRDAGIQLEAVWFPSSLSSDAVAILEVLRRHAIRTQLWVAMGDPDAKGDQQERIGAAVRALSPIAQEAEKIGCRLALYNHGGWFGQPENQLAVIKALAPHNVGAVYNLHHGHEHLDRLGEVMRMLKPHLWAVNLNGMDPAGDAKGRKILPVGQGERDIGVLQTILASGFRGPIGILGHTQDDVEMRLRDNLDGLNWLCSRINGDKSVPKPTPRTPFP